MNIHTILIVSFYLQTSGEIDVEDIISEKGEDEASSSSLSNSSTITNLSNTGLLQPTIQDSFKRIDSFSGIQTIIVSFNKFMYIFIFRWSNGNKNY